jgi:hypothetical protein
MTTPTRQMMNKANKMNAEGANKFLDFESMMFNNMEKYKNTAVVAENARMYAYEEVLKECVREIHKLSKVIDKQNQKIEELVNKNDVLAMRLTRNKNILIEEKVTETTITVSSEQPDRPFVRESKWTKDTIFRTFDIYRRDHYLFSNITPEIVRDNWRSVYNYCKKYTGMTLKELLREYADERNLNFA